MKSEMPFGALRRAFDARDHQMDNVVRHVVFAGGNENLLAREAIRSIGLRHGFGAQHAEIGAAMRFGEIHRAGPFAGNEFRQIFLLQLIAAVLVDGFISAVRQARIHAERHVRRGDHFIPRQRDDVRQTLAAIIRIGGQSRPAGFDELFVSVFETGWRRHRTVRVTRAAFVIADCVQRLQHAFAKLRALFEHLLNQIERRIREARQLAYFSMPRTSFRRKLYSRKGRRIDGMNSSGMGLGYRFWGLG